MVQNGLDLLANLAIGDGVADPFAPPTSKPLEKVIPPTESPNPQDAHRAALREKLEWAAARPLSPAAGACDLLEPIAWVFDLIARRSPDPWGPNGGAMAVRLVRVLERLAPVAQYDRGFAVIVERGLQCFAEAVNCTDEDAQAAAALGAVGALEGSLGLDVDQLRSAPQIGWAPPEAGAPDFMDGFLCSLRTRINNESFICIRTMRRGKCVGGGATCLFFLNAAIRAHLTDGGKRVADKSTDMDGSCDTLLDTSCVGMTVADLARRISFHNSPIKLGQTFARHHAERVALAKCARERGFPMSGMMTPVTTALGGGKTAHYRYFCCHDPTTWSTYVAVVTTVEGGRARLGRRLGH